jgi:hypothetical protein
MIRLCSDIRPSDNTGVAGVCGTSFPAQVFILKASILGTLESTTGFGMLLSTRSGSKEIVHLQQTL